MPAFPQEIMTNDRSHDLSMKTQILRVTLIIALTQLFLFSLSTPYVEAQGTTTDQIQMNPMKITARVHRNGTTTLVFDADVSNVGEESISTVDIRVDSLDLLILQASADGEALTTSMRNMERHTMVSLQLTQNITRNDSIQIHLEVLADDLQSELEENQSASSLFGSMTYYMRPHTPVSNFTFIAILPDYATLSHDDVIPIYPESNGNFTDGQSIGFVWYRSRILPGQENVFIVRYQTYSTDANNQMSLVLLGLVGMLGIIGGYTVSIASPKIRTRMRKIKETQYVGTTKEEAKILDIIKEKNGLCSQQELYQQLDISESKLSLVLNGLEEKRLVMRIRKGRENIIHILEGSH